MSKHAYRHRNDGLNRVRSSLRVAKAWIPFIAMTNKLCPHTRTVIQEPLKGRTHCDSCDDSIVFREFISKTALLENLSSGTC